uniref:Uncharacterized protein n=1 Tax=Placozoa sp. H17 HM-2017 TaxID=2017600 RepID=A0A7I6N2P3_9METZ|nr:hypothetical protein [Placozoa sp. H17 HM-2017]
MGPRRPILGRPAPSALPFRSLYLNWNTRGYKSFDPFVLEGKLVFVYFWILDRNRPGSRRSTGAIGPLRDRIPPEPYGTVSCHTAHTIEGGRRLRRRPLCRNYKRIPLPLRDPMDPHRIRWIPPSYY